MPLRRWIESEQAALRRVLEESARVRAEAQRVRYRASQVTEPRIGPGHARPDGAPRPPDDRPPVADASGKHGSR